MKRFVIATILLTASTLAAAATIRQFSPQGAVRDAEVATAVFSTDISPLGAVDALQPFEVQCPVNGKASWNDPHTWSYTLARPLDPSEQCVFRLKKNIQALNGERISGKTDFTVSSPGPWVLDIRPEANDNWQKIEEDQVFLMTPRSPIKPATVEAHAWCESDGVGERLPLRVLPEADLRRVLQGIGQKQVPGMFAAQCRTRLPAGAKVRLVWGRGIAGVSGGVVRDEESFVFQVQVPFRAAFSCERDKPAAPCSPLADLRLQFSAEVPWKQASGIRLVTADKAIPPWHDKNAGQDTVSEVVFKGPFASQLQALIRLPGNMQDVGGRKLVNARGFPLKVSMGAMPPLAKFPAPFGILEVKEGAVLPVTVRNVESSINMRVARFGNMEEVFGLKRDLHQFEQQTRRLSIPRPVSQVLEQEDSEAGQEALPSGNIEVTDYQYPRELSFLSDRVAESRQLPRPNGVQAFEVMGIPLRKPGFYLVELESRLLGESLLLQDNDKHPRPMYVRAAALVTDLSVHFKKGRDNSLVWVTRLSNGQPVAGAEVEIANCNGSRLWSGKTDKSGRALADVQVMASQPSRCDSGTYGYYASARLGDDFSFTQSDWNRGIEPWRFNVNTWADPQVLQIHTILDRTLLRAGETVSMKLIARKPRLLGFAYPDALPDEMTISLIGGEDETKVPLEWDARGVAVVQWKIPETARLGSYAVNLGGRWQTDGEFRVSDFRLPAYAGAIRMGKSRMGGVREVPVSLNLAYLNGGGAGGQVVQVSSMMEKSFTGFPEYRDFSFGLANEPSQKQLLADKLPVKLDQYGNAGTSLKLPQPIGSPMRLLNEMTFSDPNGEIQTIAGETELWPAEVALGLRVSEDPSPSGKRVAQAVVLDLQGKPRANATVSISAERKLQLTHRKRIIGGFYSYETEDRSENLGAVCKGKTDERGILRCEIGMEKAGEIRLTADTQDANGQHSRAGAQFWAYANSDTWFEQGDQDRMELTPFKREYQAGETLKLQVHTPFRESTALIAVEREGVIETYVRPLYRHAPVVEIPIKREWAPNVYVSVMVVRGRLHDLPWYSLFQWGWRSPVEWFKEWRAGAPQATAMVDLARPAYKFGMTEIKVGKAAMALKVKVSADKAVYAPREVAKVRVKVLLPDGKPAPKGSEVAVVAVDKALLELAPNPSWNLLDAMLQDHAYQIETATAQTQVVGKRHFGKKALPAGGGGGKLTTRELFNTLLYWNARVKLDAQGEAMVNVPLNDSLTAFKLVAVADVDTGLFGTGETEIAASQPLQMISGLPPLVRENDRYRAAITVRNGSGKPVQATISGWVGAQPLATQSVKLAANAAQEVAWQVVAPDQPGQLVWQVDAKTANAKDSIRLTQKIIPAVPVAVQQASFMRLEGHYAVPAVLPKGAIPGKGGIDLALSSSLASQAQGIIDYFEAYPFSCLEQRTSMAVGLQDNSRWESIAANLSDYLDSDGFAMYFPGPWRGSDALTAYVLGITHAQGFVVPDAPRARMEQALTGFVEGRLKPDYWTPIDNLTDRRIHALEALARLGKADAAMVGIFEVKPMTIATATLIDWYSILQKVPDVPERDARLQEVERELRNRLRYAGSGRMMFNTEEHDNWWWLMGNGDVNALRMLDIIMDNPAWKDDAPALLRGALLRQDKGHWSTTVANAWGRVALARFAKAFEGEAVTGNTQARMASAQGAYAWKAAEKTETGHIDLPWPSGTQPADLSLKHEGSGKPWVTMLVRAAIPNQTVSHGFSVTRSVTPVEQKVAGKWSRGDVVRVRVTVKSAQELSWVVVSDPTPGGASILGNTARDSNIARKDENRDIWKDNAALPSFTERGFGFFRAYYDYVPKGSFWLEYTARLNNSGSFSLPATRVEAMYAPEVFGELPNAKVTVEQQ